MRKLAIGARGTLRLSQTGSRSQAATRRRGWRRRIGPIELAEPPKGQILDENADKAALSPYKLLLDWLGLLNFPENNPSRGRPGSHPGATREPPGSGCESCEEYQGWRPPHPGAPGSTREPNFARRIFLRFKAKKYS